MPLLLRYEWDSASNPWNNYRPLWRNSHCPSDKYRHSQKGGNNSNTRSLMWTPARVNPAFPAPLQTLLLGLLIRPAKSGQAARIAVPFLAHFRPPFLLSLPAQKALFNADRKRRLAWGKREADMIKKRNKNTFSSEMLMLRVGNGK